MRTPFATSDDLSGGAHVGKAASRGRRSARKSAGDRPSSSSKGHLPPAYDIYGNQLRPGKGAGLLQQAPGVFNTADGKVSVPPAWKGHPKHTRPSQVREARRQEFIAHPSFDLDGDGVVNQRDYFFAKQFDKDGDGKLNAKVGGVGVTVGGAGGRVGGGGGVAGACGRALRTCSTRSHARTHAALCVLLTACCAHHTKLRRFG